MPPAKIIHAILFVLLPAKIAGFPAATLESFWPTLALKTGTFALHRQRTIHLQGDEKELDAIAQATLGVHLETIRNAFNQ